MPSHRETRHLPYSPAQMFALVADVARYDEFLPWVIATRVKSDSETEMIADLVVGFRHLREKFTSRVRKNSGSENPDSQHPDSGPIAHQMPGLEIDVEYLDGPLKDLENHWRFRDDNEGGCFIDFHVSFSFKNALFESLAGQYFDKAFRKMVGAFEQRADQLYGITGTA